MTRRTLRLTRLDKGLAIAVILRGQDYTGYLTGAVTVRRSAAAACTGGFGYC